MADRHVVTIKGIKQGLVFIIDDACDFSKVIEDLQFKLEKTHQQLLSGPDVKVYIKLGHRELSESERAQLIDVLKVKNNLHIQSITTDVAYVPEFIPQVQQHFQIISGIIRCGQIVELDGDVLLLGDVNPGGVIRSTGHIFIMGALRGIAHAGITGREDAIIAASVLRPIQLRIANTVSRPPEDQNQKMSSMEFAYIDDGLMQVDRGVHISKLLNEIHSIGT